MSEERHSDIPARFRDTKGIERAIRAGLQIMLRIKKLLGYPVVVGLPGGGVKIIPPEDIVLDPEFDGPVTLPDDMLP